jgi:hypothetical protein
MGKSAFLESLKCKWLLLFSVESQFAHPFLIIKIRIFFKIGSFIRLERGKWAMDARNLVWLLFHWSFIVILLIYYYFTRQKSVKGSTFIDSEGL